jgi:hypothetical protein
MSRGDIVPEVSITEEKLSNTGRIAIEQSRQEKVSKGSFNEPSYLFG